MEGGFEAERGTERPEPGFEPPVDPASGPSLHGLALVARIMRGRELAADAAGIPPLDSDQVLDLQRTAGNRLTTGALTLWTDLLTEDRTGPQALLARLLVAGAADRERHATALDDLAPRLRLHVSCTGPAGGPIEIGLRGPTGQSWVGTAALAPGESTMLEIPFAAAFGPAAGIAPEHALAVTLTRPEAPAQSLELPVPFAAPAAIAGYVALAELRA